jgi:hypothetical protein
MTSALTLSAAPVVYGRVPGADRWWRCRPADLTTEQDRWLTSVVRDATVASEELRRPGGRRWFASALGDLVCVGTAGMVGEVLPEYRFVGSRELYAVSGWVGHRPPGQIWMTADLDALRASDLFVELLEVWLGRDWSLTPSQVGDPARSEFVLVEFPDGPSDPAGPLPPLPPGSRLILPEDQTRAIWRAVVTNAPPPSLCVGFGSERAARSAGSFSITTARVGAAVHVAAPLAPGPGVPVRAGTARPPSGGAPEAPAPRAGGLFDRVVRGVEVAVHGLLREIRPGVRHGERDRDPDEPLPSPDPATPRATPTDRDALFGSFKPIGENGSAPPERTSSDDDPTDRPR